MKKTTVSQVRTRHEKQMALMCAYREALPQIYKDIDFLLGKIKDLTRENNNLRKSMRNKPAPKGHTKYGRGTVKTVGPGKFAKSSRWNEVK